MERLSSLQTNQVLGYLGVEDGPPDLALLERLLLRYAQTVPWESVSRIARRAQHGTLVCPPRLSGEFWADAIRDGTGGTCFESNWAFFALLTALGYEGYLTINNMHETIGCHTAIILRLEGQFWLVDAGYPIYIVCANCRSCWIVCRGWYNIVRTIPTSTASHGIIRRIIAC